MKTVLCDECGKEYGIGDWPLCASRANPDGHSKPRAYHPFVPYVDVHIQSNGKPVLIESLAHKWRLMKDNKVDYMANKVGNKGCEV